MYQRSKFSFQHIVRNSLYERSIHLTRPAGKTKRGCKVKTFVSTLRGLKGLHQGWEGCGPGEQMARIRIFVTPKLEQNIE